MKRALSITAGLVALAGCTEVEKICTDEMSGAKAERPGLQEALAFVRAGDTLVVWRLDRLGRTAKGLTALFEELQHLGVGLVSLKEGHAASSHRQDRRRGGPRWAATDHDHIDARGHVSRNMSL